MVIPFKLNQTFNWKPNEFCSMRLRVVTLEGEGAIVAEECDNFGEGNGDFYRFTEEAVRRDPNFFTEQTSKEASA